MSILCHRDTQAIVVQDELMGQLLFIAAVLILTSDIVYSKTNCRNHALILVSYLMQFIVNKKIITHIN